MIKALLRSEKAQIIFILGAALLIVFWPVFLKGQVLAPADIPPFFDLTMRELNSDLTPPQNPLLSDHINQFYVWHHLAGEAMQRTGKIPLWNPYLLSGQPLVANAQPALFYPPNLLLFWLSPGMVATVRTLFNLFVAGFFTFLLARTLGVSKWGAVLAALAFTFSGALVVGPGHAYANCLVWLPLMMWGGEKILAGSRPCFWGLVTGVGVGLSILGGHPESTFHNMQVFVLFFGMRWWMRPLPWRKKGRLLLAVGGALFLGLLLGAVQWLPFADWLAQSATGSRSVIRGTDSFFYAKDWLYNLPLLLTLLFPTFFGHPVDYTYRWPFPTFQNFLEQSMYIGLIPIALAVGAMAISWRRGQRRWLPVALLAILCLGIGLRLPGFELVNHLPLFDRINNTRLKWYFSFLAALLAGRGLDILRLHHLQGRNLLRRGAVRAMQVVWGLALSVAILIFLGKYALWPLLATTDDSFLSHLLWEIFSWQQRRMAVTLAVLLLGTIGYGLMQTRSKSFSGWRGMLVALTFLELVVLAEGYNTAVPPQTIFPDTQLTSTLRQDPALFRIAAMPPVFWPNYGAVYDLFHVGGYDLPVNQRVSDVYQAQGGSGYRQVWSPDWPLVDWMNIKYFVRDHPLEGEKYELILAGNGYFLYRNQSVLPRAYVVYDSVTLPDDEAQLVELVSGGFPFAERVILDRDLPVRLEPPDGGKQEGLTAVRAIRYENDSVTLDVVTEMPGVLVLSDLYTAGWKAWLDGQETSLYRANYAYRAVLVPAGEHQVIFRYKPWAYTVGKSLALAGLLLVLGGLLWTWWNDRKQQSPQHTNKIRRRSA